MIYERCFAAANAILMDGGEEPPSFLFWEIIA